MDESRFRAFAAKGVRRVPIVHETVADLDTALAIYLKLANRPYSYLLESVIGGERFGRYSYIGLSAPTRIEAHGRRVTVHRGSAVIERAEGVHPLDFVRDYLRRRPTTRLPGMPRFVGGLAGYFGYDTMRWIEPRLGGGWLKGDPIGCPDMLLLECEELAVIDNLSGTLQLIVHADPTEEGSYRAAQARLRELLGALRLPLAMAPEPGTALGEPVANMTKEAFVDAVGRAQELIRAGDAMQIVLSQRFSRAYRGSGVSFYRALRALNPSPYLFHFDFAGFQVIGSSPEILVRLEGDEVTLRPLAGTRPRGLTPADDRAREQELLADAKERAEHAMLLDLGRNDVGRVARTGSVQVTEQMAIERYSHVMHIVSNVRGVLEPGLDWADVFRATFPAGTVSGAPKVRAMEIIDELEPERRGIYAGAVGFIGFDGNADLAIAIRTGILKDGMLHVQAGAGVVADSQPEAEWEETCAKARALLRAAETATDRERKERAPLTLGANA